MNSDRRIGTIGTVARVIVGIALIVIAFALDMGWADVIGAVVVLPVVALAAVILLNRVFPVSALQPRGRATWSATQSVAAVVVLLAVIAIGIGLTVITPMDGAGSILAFFGASMVAAAIAGYDGCEVLALPNLLLGRHDTIWCPLYTPLDRAEDRARLSSDDATDC